jgi:hypothetical protein
MAVSTKRQILSHLIPYTTNMLKIHFNIIPPSSPRRLTQPVPPAPPVHYTVCSPQMTVTKRGTYTHGASPVVCLYALTCCLPTKHYPHQFLLRYSQSIFLLCSRRSRFTLAQKNANTDFRLYRLC